MPFITKFHILAVAYILATSLSFAATDHEFRNGLPQLSRKLAEDSSNIRVSFFGGSITLGAGASNPRETYSVILTTWLQNQYPKSKFHYSNTSIASSGSWLGAYRCVPDLSAHRPDIVFIEFATADTLLPHDQILANVEGIVRQLRTKLPTKPDLVFVYPFSVTDLDLFKNSRRPPVFEIYEKVAAHYGIPGVFVANSAAKTIIDGSISPKSFSADGFNPSSAGHKIYAESLQKFLTEVTARPPGTLPGQELPAPLSPRPLDNATLVSYSTASHDSAWQVGQPSPNNRIPHLAICDDPGSPITLRFKGTEAGIYNIIGPDTGNIEFSLNDGPWQPKVLFDKACPIYFRPAASPLVRNLDPSVTHTLKIRPAPTPPAESKGRLIRLGYFLVDGTPIDSGSHLTKLERIDSIYAKMKPLAYQPPQNRWNGLTKTRSKLTTGGPLKIVLLGDSIIGDTSSSDFELLLAREYPKAHITKVTSVRGSTGCKYYQDENRVEEYVVRHQPDLLIIGGISHSNDIGAVESVIDQSVKKLPDLEVLLISPVFGATTDLHNRNWTPRPDREKFAFRHDLQTLANTRNTGFFDMTGPWWEYIQNSAQPLEFFKRDYVHANDFGKQLLGRLLVTHLSPQ